MTSSVTAALLALLVSPIGGATVAPPAPHKRGSPVAMTADAPSPRHGSSPGMWGVEGHHIVALLAAPLLDSAAAAKVSALLDGRPMASIASWADSIRRVRPETAPFHYVNIPLNETTYDPARDCPAGKCLIHAISEFRRTLADTTADRTARVEALEFLVHFIGDLHQPLHCEDNGDRGGNSVRVTFRGHSTNLHSVWDTWLIEGMGLSEPELLARLRREMDTMGLAAVRAGTVVQWAEESHQLASDAYALPANGRLDRAYQRMATPIVDRQLIRAAVRLAEVLNHALG